MKKISGMSGKGKQPRKQRKYRYDAPLHVRQRFIHAHLSPELRKKYGKRGLGLRKGDKVKVMRGQFRKHTGNVESVDLKRGRAVVTGIEITKKEGSKTVYPVNVSNLMIVELNTDDKKRKKVLERKK